eukprot:scaffold26981_cov80-Skeletonema_marinoi.AAC.2
MIYEPPQRRFPTTTYILQPRSQQNLLLLQAALHRSTTLAITSKRWQDEGLKEMFVHTNNLSKGNGLFGTNGYNSGSLKDHVSDARKLILSSLSKETATRVVFEGVSYMQCVITAENNGARL